MKHTGNKTPILFGVNAQPGRVFNWVLALLPFVLVIVIYMMASNIRHAENPQDKLLPTPSKMLNTIERLAFTPDKRSGKYLLLADTLASLQRLLIGVSLAAMTGLLLGLNMGIYPGMNATLNAFVTFVSMIPPLAILPILFITFGVDELAKVMLIYLGIVPVITRDIFLSVKKISQEQITKALTLGASQLELTYRIVLPLILPRLIQTLRLTLGAAWLFLIAAEAIAADQGLGYRIFLVRRYLAMDIILPYVMWITILGFMFDYILRSLLVKAFPWYSK